MSLLEGTAKQRKDKKARPKKGSRASDAGARPRDDEGHSSVGVSLENLTIEYDDDQSKALDAFYDDDEEEEEE